MKVRESVIGIGLSRTLNMTRAPPRIISCRSMKCNKNVPANVTHRKYEFGPSALRRDDLCVPAEMAGARSAAGAKIPSKRASSSDRGSLLLGLYFSRGSSGNGCRIRFASASHNLFAIHGSPASRLCLWKMRWWSRQSYGARSTGPMAFENARCRAVYRSRWFSCSWRRRTAHPGR